MTTVKITILHRCNDNRNVHWAQPVDWEPSIPEEFKRPGYTLDEGSIWGEEEEEAGLVYFGDAEEGDTLEVDLVSLNWVYCNVSGIQHTDVPYVSVAPTTLA